MAPTTLVSQPSPVNALLVGEYHGCPSNVDNVWYLKKIILNFHKKVDKKIQTASLYKFLIQKKIMDHMQ